MDLLPIIDTGTFARREAEVEEEAEIRQFISIVFVSHGYME